MDDAPTGVGLPLVCGQRLGNQASARSRLRCIWITPSYDVAIHAIGHLAYKISSRKERQIQEQGRMPPHAIGYVSHAIPNLGTIELDKIVNRAAAQNLIAGVSGLLLFDGSRFLQYIEGAEDGISLVYLRIRNSGSHTDLVELAPGTVIQCRIP